MNKNVSVILNQEVNGRNLKIYGTARQPLFLAKDVAEFIGHSDRVKMIKFVDEDEKVKKIVPTLGGNQCMWFLTEDGLYEVLMQSRKTVAKNFKKEVKKILKAIRQNGMYINDNVLEVMMNNPDLIIELLTKVKKDKEEAEKLREQIEEQKPFVALAKSAAEGRLLLSIKEFSVILDNHGVDLGEKKLLKWFRDNSYLMKKKGLDHNMPLQKSLNMELFKVTESEYLKEDGKIGTRKDVMITGKGQLYFMDKLLKREKKN